MSQADNNVAREFEGKTVEHAIEIACGKLGCDQDELEIKIITRGSSGIFGLGGRNARISVARKSPSPMDQFAPQEAEEQDLPDLSKYGPVASHEPMEAEVEEETRSAEEVKEEEGVEEQPPSPGDREEEHPTEEQLEAGRQILGHLLDKAGIEADIQVLSGDQGPVIDLSGQDISLIIGKDGQTLDALEYLMNRMVRQKLDEPVRLHLDAGGYRDKKEESLRRLAMKMAKKAKQTGRSVALHPMSARDRRLIHITLKEVKGVSTRSVGDGLMKKIVVMPARKKNKGRPQRAKRN